LESEKWTGFQSKESWEDKCVKMDVERGEGLGHIPQDHRNQTRRLKTTITTRLINWSSFGWGMENL
jgi:hypothetical protein